jgi:phosphoribosylformylglycinamidine cyclo-ligase
VPAKKAPARRSPARKPAPAARRGPARKAAPARSRKPAAKAPRAPAPKPARRRVVVKRPVAHEPAPLPVRPDAFEVQMDAPRRAAPALTYAATGVDIQREDKAIEALAGMVSFRRQGFGAPLGTIGHFAGIIGFGDQDALVLCTDGVGSKVEVANALRKWDTVGIDCVAMNVNDCICVGAEPLAFVDYLAVQDPDPELTRQVGVGLNEGCRQADCSLVGGETASLPGIIKGFDLAGTCLGHVRRDAIVDGSRIAPGDVLIGLASSGIHSNGYSLARRAFESAGHRYTDPWPWPEDKAYAGKSVGEVLLEPTRIYVREVVSLLRSGIPVHGLAHVTGSGLRKVRRANPGVRYDLADPLPVPPVFRRIQQLGGVSDHEMYRTFNMGMGFVVVVPEAAARKAVAHLRKLAGYQVQAVGRVGEGSGVVHPVGGEH